MSGASESAADEQTGNEWTRRPVGDRRAWLTVARKDVADAARSWQAYVLAAVFTTAMTFGGLEPVLSVMAIEIANPTYAAHDGLIGIANATEAVVPLVGLLFGHVAITGEYERGSLRTLLALPISRRDVLLGTLFGRIVVFWTMAGVGLAVSLVSMWLLYDDLDVITFAGVSAMVLVFGAVFVTMAVGISAASRTRGRALGWTMAVFALFTFLWDVVLALHELVTDHPPPVEYLTEPDRAAGTYVFLDRAHPSTAWRHVVSDWIVPVFTDAKIGTGRHDPTLTTHGPEPFYLDEWVLLVVLLAWGVVPLAVGYWRFRNAEVA